MSEGEKEIMAHIMAIESVLMTAYGIKRKDWNIGLQELREQIKNETKEEK